MSLHDQNLFSACWMLVTPHGVIDGPLRVSQWVKWKTIDVLVEKSGIGFNYDSVHFDWNGHSSWTIYISAKKSQRSFQIVWNFSTQLVDTHNKKKRYIAFDNISFRKEFGEWEINSDFLSESKKDIISELQPYILSELFRKEEQENLAEF